MARASPSDPEQSQDVLLVDHGTYYPALQGLENKGWIDAEWGTLATNRRARFYSLTNAGLWPHRLAHNRLLD